MNPDVKELVSLNVYRDGGSLSVSFRDHEGTQHVLKFLVNNFASDQGGDFKFYKSVSIKSYTKSEYVSPVTGIPTPKIEVEEGSISWESAKILLDKLDPLIKSFQSDYLWVFHSMVTIAGNEDHAIKYS